jgi:tRNA (guanine-N7-)-methyltransferase
VSNDSSSSSSRRPIRSYVIRAGRQTDAQRKALDLYWSDYVIEYHATPLDLNTLFAEQARLVVEIGFGMGDSLLEMAKSDPHSNFLGIEVHRPGIGKLLHGITQHELTNLKVICHDAKEVIAQCFTDETIDRLLIFFPDPWPKQRHNKRRLVQLPFMELATLKLKPGAEIHLATDWQAYAEHMMEVMEGTSNLANRLGPACYWEQAERPATQFESRGKRLGHGVWDLLFVKN